MTAQYVVLFFELWVVLALFVFVILTVGKLWLGRKRSPKADKVPSRTAYVGHVLGRAPEDAMDHFSGPVGLRREVTHDCPLPSLLALRGTYRFRCPTCHSDFEAAAGDRIWKLTCRHGRQWVQVADAAGHTDACGETGAAS